MYPIVWGVDAKNVSSSLNDCNTSLSWPFAYHTIGTLRPEPNACLLTNWCFCELVPEKEKESTTFPLLFIVTFLLNLRLFYFTFFCRTSNIPICHTFVACLPYRVVNTTFFSIKFLSAEVLRFSLGLSMH